MNDLEREIARINKMRLPAGTRSDLVRRARIVSACVPQPGVTGADVWCGRCGFQLRDHPAWWRARAAEDVTTLADWTRRRAP
jgi:hypothetical protein